LGYRFQLSTFILSPRGCILNESDHKSPVSCRFMARPRPQTYKELLSNPLRTQLTHQKPFEKSWNRVKKLSIYILQISLKTNTSAIHFEQGEESYLDVKQNLNRFSYNYGRKSQYGRGAFSAIKVFDFASRFGGAIQNALLKNSV